MLQENENHPSSESLTDSGVKTQVCICVTTLIGFSKVFKLVVKEVELSTI